MNSCWGKRWMDVWVDGVCLFRTFCVLCVQMDSQFILRADWNWYSSKRISFIDSCMDEKLKYGSVMTMLVSAKSTWIWRIQEGDIRLDESFLNISSEQVRMLQDTNLKHLFSKQVVPHFPLDIPVDQITLKWNDRKLTWQRNNFWEIQLPACGDSILPSGRGECKIDLKDLWSHQADWL